VRALFDRLARMEDLVPFVELADGLPTPVEQIDDRLWVQRDDLTSSRYGGNKVRKFEFVLPVAQRRGGPILTAGGIGSHHVLAAAIWGRQLGLDVEAVMFPQPVTDDVRHTQAELRKVGARVTLTPHRYLMPVTLAQRMAALAVRRPYLVWPGASTPLGTLGYVSAGLELVASGIPEPDSVVVSLGSGGTCVGLALGLRLGGWTKAKVVAARAADVTVTNMAVLGSLEAATASLLALGGWVPKPARLKIDTGWLGPGYGHPTEAGEAATRAAEAYGLAVEPTYTAKAFACALDRHNDGQRVVFVQTYAGSGAAAAAA
jgi:D-cysteine desulfhydrase